MNFKLSSYDIITSKKNGKDYIIIHCIFNGRIFYNLILPMTEMNEEFCKNNKNEDITEYISFRYLYKDNLFVPYIKL